MRKSGWEPRLRLKALPTGLNNVTENRLLLKYNKKIKKNQREVGSEA